MRTGLFSDSELIIAPLQSKETDMHLAQLADKFNIHDTKCYRDVDRQTIFGIVETAGDGHTGFTEAVRSLAKGAGEAIGTEVPPEDFPSKAPGSLRKRAAAGGPTPPPSPAASSSADVEEMAQAAEEAEEEEEEKVEVVVA